MKKIAKGFSIVEYIIEPALTSGVKTEIGTAQDYEDMKICAAQSGLFQVSCKIGGNPMKGTCLVNGPTDSYIDFGCISNYSGSATFITGTVTLEDGKMYVIVTVS